MLKLKLPSKYTLSHEMYQHQDQGLRGRGRGWENIEILQEYSPTIIFVWLAVTLFNYLSTSSWNYLGIHQSRRKFGEKEVRKVESPKLVWLNPDVRNPLMRDSWSFLDNPLMFVVCSSTGPPYVSQSARQCLSLKPSVDGRRGAGADIDWALPGWDLSFYLSQSSLVTLPSPDSYSL